jgi:hypothetical protein
MMSFFRGETAERKYIAPSRKLWTDLHALDGYLSGQSAWLVNYAERHRAGLRVGTALTEGTAKFLVNRRMNKSQQMCRSRRGADLLLHVRCAVYNGTFGSDFGQKFQRSIPADGDRSVTPNLAEVPAMITDRRKRIPTASCSYRRCRHRRTFPQDPRSSLNLRETGLQRLIQRKVPEPNRPALHLHLHLHR